LRTGKPNLGESRGLKSQQPSALQALQAKLLAWYRHNQRDLPWRRIKDPYPVWISEVMLQQTQVQTVIPYYLRFLERFPNVNALATSETEQVLRLWAGLGYYSRARNLQRAARLVIERFGGEFPRSYNDVLSLPGIGRYTAAAILSIAFDQPYAVLDGNVTRVVSRLIGIEGDPKSTAVQNALWATAQKLLPSRDPGDFNQAIMELGATLCSPRQPRCLLCPWQAECAARRAGRQETFPQKLKRPVSRKSKQVAIVIAHRGRFLIVHRSEQPLLRDFWEFPSAELQETEDLETVIAFWIDQKYGLRITKLEPLLTIKHSITFRRIELSVFQTALKRHSSLRGERPKARWVRLSEIQSYPLASASRQIVEALQARHKPH
jgi:A/G-specific adenine glycosylase